MESSRPSRPNPPALAPKPASLQPSPAHHHQHHPSMAVPALPALTPIQPQLPQQQQAARIQQQQPPLYHHHQLAQLAVAAAAAALLGPATSQATPASLPPLLPRPSHSQQPQLQAIQQQSQQNPQNSQQQQQTQTHWSAPPALRPAPCVATGAPTTRGGAQAISSQHHHHHQASMSQPPKLQSAPQLQQQPSYLLHPQPIAAKPTSRQLQPTAGTPALAAAHHQSLAAAHHPAFIQPAHVTKTVYSDVISLTSNSNNVVYDLSKKPAKQQPQPQAPVVVSPIAQQPQQQQQPRLPISPRLPTVVTVGAAPGSQVTVIGGVVGGASATSALPVCRVSPLKSQQQLQSAAAVCLAVPLTAAATTVVTTVVSSSPVSGSAKLFGAPPSATSSAVGRSSAFRPIAPNRPQLASASPQLPKPVSVTHVTVVPRPSPPPQPQTAPATPPPQSLAPPPPPAVIANGRSSSRPSTPAAVAAAAPLVTPSDFASEIRSLDPNAELDSRLCNSPGSVGEDLVWLDDCGFLPGTGMRFRKTNGILELIEDCAGDLDGSRSRHSSADRDSSGSTVPMVIDDRQLSGSGNNSLSDHHNHQPAQQQLQQHLRFVCRSCGSEGHVRGSLNGAGEFCTESCSKLPPIAVAFVVPPSGRKRKRSGLASGEEAAASQQQQKKMQICQVDVENAAKYHGPNGTFLWKKYLKDTGSQAAPERFFSHVYASTVQNRVAEFEVGMVLEGIDPCHESLICCLSISEVQGCRLRLHFEGYTDLHDFWCCADSPFIFPVGWANHNGFPLQPPRAYEPGKFNWFDYVMANQLRAVPRCLFTVPWNLPLSDHGFSEGQKLEAVDPRNPEHICVATVAMVMGDRVCLHFDGWDNSYDMWTKVDSPTIHPVGWCEQNERALSLPVEWCRQIFTWDRYLESTGSEPVMPAAFQPRPPVPFILGMKLEFVDPRNTRLIRIGTVVDPGPHPGFLLVLPDGWGEKFAFVVPDSSLDVFPVGYCRRTGHQLEPLPTWHDSEKFTCPTVGCRGLGHVKGPGYKSHSSIKSCPYAERNWQREVPDRLETEGAAAAATAGEDSANNNGHGNSATTQQRGRPGKRPPGNQQTQLSHQQLPLPAPSPGCPFYKSVFAPSVFPYDPCKDTGPLVWPEHIHLIPALAAVQVGEVPAWSVAETSQLVRQLPGCEPFADSFIVEEIDGDAFLHLQQIDLLTILRMPLGPAIKLAQAISAIRESLQAAA